MGERAKGHSEWRTHFEVLNCAGRAAPACGYPYFMPRLTRHPPDVDCQRCQKTNVFARERYDWEAGTFWPEGP